MAILKDGLKSGEVHFADTTVSIIYAKPEILNLLLDTGLGGDCMKNLGSLEVIDG